MIKKTLKETYLNYRFIINKTGLSKDKFIIVISLTLFTAILDAAGIGILLPIAEYILESENGSIPNTNSWKILIKVFNYVGIDPNIIIITTVTICIIILRQISNYFKGFIIENININNFITQTSFF